MDTSVKAIAVQFDESTMWLDLDDGRTLGIPLVWYPRLLDGTPEQRAKVEIGTVGLHWDELDEDITVAGLLAGRRDQTTRRPQAA